MSRSSDPLSDTVRENVLKWVEHHNTSMWVTGKLVYPNNPGQLRYIIVGRTDVSITVATLGHIARGLGVNARDLIDPDMWRET